MVCYKLRLDVLVGRDIGGTSDVDGDLLCTYANNFFGL